MKAFDIPTGHASISAARALRVKSALNPMLWLTGIASPLCFFAAYAFRSEAPIEIALVVAGIVPIVVTCLGFAYFAVSKPEKLQSEEYQLRHEALQTIQRQGSALPLDPTSLHAITNPTVQFLPGAGSNDD